MSNAHKAALAEGRRLSADVCSYLEALEGRRHRSTSRRSPEVLERRLRETESKLRDATGIERVHLAQQRIELARELDDAAGEDDIANAEHRFVRSAKAFAERKQLSYAAFREVGVPAAVLKRAGFSRSTDFSPSR